MYDHKMIENWVCHNLLVYTRGQAVIALTNSKENIEQIVKRTPFKINDIVCNIFDTKDCVVVKDTGLKVTMAGGKPKVYVLKGDLQDPETLM
jgi:hypothetical protein